LYNNQIPVFISFDAVDALVTLAQNEALVDAVDILVSVRTDRKAVDLCCQFHQSNVTTLDLANRLFRLQSNLN
jgi:hypothetical protein